MKPEMLFLACIRYTNPETEETLLAKDSVFGLNVAHWLYAEYGFDRFDLIEDATAIPVVTTPFSFDA